LAAEEVAGVRITLDISERRLLELDWQADGQLTRQGNGRESGRQSSRVEGHVSANDFEAVRRHVSGDLLACRGQFTDRAARGNACRLEIVLSHRQGPKWTTTWQYGTESTGPPEPVRRFVSELVRLTGRWYEQSQVTVVKRPVA
jgi:hypothetical protein